MLSGGKRIRCMCLFKTQPLEKNNNTLCIVSETQPTHNNNGKGHNGNIGNSVPSFRTNGQI